MDAGSIPLELATLGDMCEELRRRGHAAIVAITKPVDPDNYPQLIGKFATIHDVVIRATNVDEGL